jgi:hypothetical protein
MANLPSDVIGGDAEDDDGHGWTLLRHAIDAEHDRHAQSGEPLHADVTAFLLARGADPLRPCNGKTVIDEALHLGHWLAAEIMRPRHRADDTETRPVMGRNH